MAQAPDAQGGRGPGAGASAPRLNETVKQFSGMNTREGRNAVPKGAFPWLENIQPIAPGNLHSIPGRGQSVSRVPPIPVPPTCTDATERGQQALAEELRFINNDDHGGNTRTSWSHIASGEILYTLVGAAGCGGGNMTYTDACCQINHFVGSGTPFDHPALVSPDGWPAINCVMGISDEPCYHFSSSGYRKVYFPASNLMVNFASPDGSGFGAFSSFAKKGSNFYAMNANYGGGDHPGHRFWAYNYPAGTFIFESTELEDYDVLLAGCTDNFVYALASRYQGSATPVLGIFKLNRSAGHIVASYDVDNINARAIYPVNDDLIYVFGGGGKAALWYLKTFSDLMYVGSFNATNAPFFNDSAYFVDGAFYYGYMGFGGFNTDIFRVQTTCPDGDPIIASITTDATVAAGANLTVDWADVLEPVLTDRLFLKANDGTRFAISPVSQQMPGTGQGSGTFEFPIPGGTTPGSYVMQYVFEGTNLVCTSAPFTVT